MARNFQRRVEDFVCAHCGTAVTGDGYTNHCPSCLCSLHVDIHPGDRAAACGGLMEPIAVEQRGPGFVIVHRCRRCKFERTNRCSANDDLDGILAVMRARFHRLD
ncbi:RNHCP domain-containing protein [Fodinicurvata sp. EGI_FJ10296]|uniref:RNHCP domain-containing protein n=1 Tax=Fodinicurvata sp. EGI_FJ10296 TaxID=3231908 RepID=UPI0034549CC5